MPTDAGQALLDTFDRIRIISLVQRTDRRREMTGELERLGLPVDGTHIAFHDACRPDDAGHFPSIGARGCFHSHLDILRETLASDARNILILEDDLDFSKDAEARLPAMLTALRALPWAIFYGGYEQYGGRLDKAPLSLADCAETIRTTHCLAFSREAVTAAVPYLARMAEGRPGDPAGGPMHVDGAYSWFRKAHPAFATYLATPEIGHQRPSRTDIHALGLTDRMPVLRETKAFMRRIKRQLGRMRHVD